MFSSTIKKITVSPILSMKEVKSWLNNHRKIYDLACAEEEKSKKEMVELSNGIRVRRSFFEDDMPEYLQLISIYRELDILAEYHQYESYFKQELEHYQTIKESEKILQGWLWKNMNLGFNKFSLFAAEYVDYEGNEDFGEDICPIKPYISHMPELNIYIYRKDFRYTLEFIDLFHYLFYDKKLLKNSLERIQADFIEFEKYRLN